MSRSCTLLNVLGISFISSRVLEMSVRYLHGLGSLQASYLEFLFNSNNDSKTYLTVVLYCTIKADPASIHENEGWAVSLSINPWA